MKIANIWFFSKVLILAPVFAFREDLRVINLHLILWILMIHPSYFISGNHANFHWKEDDRLLSLLPCHDSVFVDSLIILKLILIYMQLTNAPTSKSCFTAGLLMSSEGSSIQMRMLNVTPYTVFSEVHWNKNIWPWLHFQSQHWPIRQILLFF